MIKINLLGDDTAIDHTGLLFVAGYAASVLLFLGVFFLLHSSIVSQIDESTTEVKSLETRLAKLQETTKEVKELEKKRKELREKLAVIARLKKSKIGPVFVMDDLNRSLPEKAWLTGMREKSDSMRIDGFALDNQTIAGFMKDLGKSDYYKTVDLVETKQTARGGVKLKIFTLQTKISYAGKVGNAEPEDEKKSSRASYDWAKASE